MLKDKRSEFDKKILSVYRKTHFFVQNLEKRLVSFTSGTIHRHPFLKKKKFAVITAWNPMNKPLSLRANQKNNQVLEARLKKTKYCFYKTRGFWRGHSEESFTIEGISKKKAVQLGDEFRQYAILYHDQNGMHFLRCHSMHPESKNEKKA